MTSPAPSNMPPPPQNGPNHGPATVWYKRKGAVISGVAILALLIGVGIGTGAKKEKKVAGPTTTVSATATLTPAPAGTRTLQPTVVRTQVRTTVNRVVATRTKVRTVTYTPPVQESISDGTYETGRDIESGRYRTPGGSDCYFSVNSDANGSDIVENGDSTGPQIVDVRDGQYLELSGGCTWERR